jgi:hypothetical protein
VPAEYEKIGFPQVDPRPKNCNFLQNGLNDFDYISEIYGECLPKQNSTGGIFRKVTVRTLVGQNAKNVNVLENGFTNF